MSSHVRIVVPSLVRNISLYKKHIKHNIPSNFYSSKISLLREEKGDFKTDAHVTIREYSEKWKSKGEGDNRKQIDDLHNLIKAASEKKKY